MASIEHHHQSLMVHGVLDFDSVIELRKKGLDLLKQQDINEIDLSGVTHSTSAGVALLLEWLRCKKALRIVNVPAQMGAVIEVSGLSDILGVG